MEDDGTVVSIIWDYGCQAVTWSVQLPVTAHDILNSPSNHNSVLNIFLLYSTLDSTHICVKLYTTIHILKLPRAGIAAPTDELSDWLGGYPNNSQPMVQSDIMSVQRMMQEQQEMLQNVI